MRTLLPLLAILLVFLALQCDAQHHEKRSSKDITEATLTTRRAFTPMRRRPMFRRRPTPSIRKPTTPMSRALLARRGPAPPAVPTKSPTTEPENRNAPGIVPPKGIASQLNQAKFHEFMSLARSLMKSRRALA